MLSHTKTSWSITIKAVRRGGNLQKYALRPTIFYLMVLWPLADPVAVHDWS